MSLDDFLENQSEAGVDSTGEFTVSLDKAAWKMASFRLANRYDAAVHLLAGAVAGQAGYFRARLTGSEVQFEFDGQAFSELDLLSLSGNAPSHQPVRLKELEIALSAAAASDMVTFSTVGPEGGHSLVLHDGDIKLTSAPRKPVARSLMTIRTENGDAYLQVLRERACHAPLELVLHWKEVSTPIDRELPDESRLARYYVKGNEKLLLSTDCESPEFNLAQETEDSPTLLLYLVDPISSHGGVLHFLSCGVELKEETKPTLPPFLWGVVTVGALGKDLGQKSLLKDGRWENFCQWVSQQIDAFLNGVCASQTHIPGEGIFRDQLRRYYAGQPPAQVKNYLNLYQGGKEMSTSPRHYEGLVETARETNDWRLCERVLTALERKLYFQWLAGDVESRSLENLQKLTSLMESHPERTPALKCCLRFFRGQLPSEADLESLPGSFSRYSQARFRTALLSLPFTEADAWLSNLAHVPGQDGWKSLLRFFLTKESQGPRDGLFFPLSRIRDGEFRDISSLFPRLDDAPQTSPERVLWRYLLLDLVRGKISWFTEIALRAKISMSGDLTPDQQNIYTEATERHKLGTLKDMENVLDLGPPAQVFVYLCYLRCRRVNFRTEQGRTLLGRLLLAESFRGPEQLLSLSARMADLPFVR